MSRYARVAVMELEFPGESWESVTSRRHGSALSVGVCLSRQLPSGWPELAEALKLLPPAQLRIVNTSTLAFPYPHLRQPRIQLFSLYSPAYLLYHDRSGSVEQLMGRT